MRIARKLRTAVLCCAMLSMATPSFAFDIFGLIPNLIPTSTTKKEAWSCYLKGVDKYGCLTDCGGKCVTYCAVINTCTGKFTGSVSSCVKNCSCRNQCYEGVNFIGNCRAKVECSKYTVSWYGSCCYTASGCVI